MFARSPTLEIKDVPPECHTNAMYTVKINYNTYAWPDYETAKEFAEYWGVEDSIRKVK